MPRQVAECGMGGDERRPGTVGEPGPVRRAQLVEPAGEVGCGWDEQQVAGLVFGVIGTGVQRGHGLDTEVGEEPAPADVSAEGEITVTFTLSEPRSPADLGLGADTRPLGIGIERMWLAD